MCISRNAKGVHSGMHDEVLGSVVRSIENGIYEFSGLTAGNVSRVTRGSRRQLIERWAKGKTSDRRRLQAREYRR
jgi:hypothetical protein